jgi:hypothetical protein
MLGWLHVKPEKAEEPRIVTEPDWPLPDCGAFSYIVEWFLELQMDFSYQEVRAWSDLMSQPVEPWEINALMMMSNTYRSGLFTYRKDSFNLYPPYDGRTDEQRGKMNDKRLSVLFGD